MPLKKIRFNKTVCLHNFQGIRGLQFPFANAVSLTLKIQQ